MKQPGKKPQGKIYDKYFNIIRKLKTNGVLQKRSHTNQPFTSVKKQMLNKGKNRKILP